MAEGPDDTTLIAISRKLNVLIALSLKQLPEGSEVGAKAKRKQGVTEQVHYLANMGLDAKDIAEIVGSPLTSVRTLLTPTRRK